MIPDRISDTKRYRALVETAVSTDWMPYGTVEYRLIDTQIGKQILALSKEEQCYFLIASIEWLRSTQIPAMYPGNKPRWRIAFIMQTLLKQHLPFDHEGILMLLDWSLDQPGPWSSSRRQVISALKYYLQNHTITSALVERIDKLISHLERGHSVAETRKWIIQLKELAGIEQSGLPLFEGEAWSDVAITDIRSQSDSQQQAWITLMNLCLKATGNKPSTKWFKTGATVINTISESAFQQAIVKWFPLVDKPRTKAIAALPRYGPNPNLLIQGANADILKGLAWLCSQSDDEGVAQALTMLALSAYRKIPGVGPRCTRLGNACVWALGNMPSMNGVAQLAILKAKLKIGSVQKAIEKTLAVAAVRSSLSLDEIEEMAVPTYGLQEVGLRREELSGYTVEITVANTDEITLSWIKSDGKHQSGVPQIIKRQNAEELKANLQYVKDIRKMLPAQRDRIDRLFLQQRKWTFRMWRERYLDHPLIGTLARRLIWKFTQGDRATSGIWLQGQIVDRKTQVIDWLDDETQIELWHPIQSSTEVVLEWRDWLFEHQVRQPIKQAYREIYVLTDAERATRVYSNRYAAHIIRQHQFNALCAVRRWNNKLRLMVDADYPPANRLIQPYGLRAEFWVESVGDTYGVDTNPTGTFLYLATDQVRFYPVAAPEHRSHASGGGYYTGRFLGDRPTESLELDNVPPLVFSEIMRDIDMFVGVASVGNDPTWFDGGPNGRFQDYWSRYSFGHLSQTAETRRQILERLIPRLKIAQKCKLNDRFLIVQGDLRIYKIHLGSGNILMEPNDQYLCIVPARSLAKQGTVDKIFLPFEGDQTLAIILSKAFLLADDKKIKDPTIVRQIQR